MHARTSFLRAAIAVAALSLAAAPAGAQAFAYPSFQLPRVTGREFNFALADADGRFNDATSLVFQWREGRGSRNQLSLDVGFSDIGPDGALLLGGQFAHQIVTSSASTPFDVLFTVGANMARVDNEFDDYTLLRVPVGVSAGRAFPIEGGMSITPYLHPRFVFADGRNDSELGIEFDLGGEFKFSPAFGVRLSATLGDDEINNDSFGVSLAWTPGVVPRTRR